MGKLRALFINGCFGHAAERLILRYAPIVGAQVAVVEEYGDYIFHGTIEIRGDEPGIGTMTDHYGLSELSEVVLTADELVYVKTYRRTGNSVRYELTRTENGIWRGTYSGKAAGTGPAWCMLNEIPISEG